MDAKGTRTVRRSLIQVIAMLALLGFVAGACGSGGNKGSSNNAGSDDNVGRVTVPEGDAQYGGTLVVGVSAESDGWTPQTNTFADAGVFVIASVVESLAVFDKDGEAVPYLAEGWEPD